MAKHQRKQNRRRHKKKKIVLELKDRIGESLNRNEKSIKADLEGKQVEGSLEGMEEFQQIFEKFNEEKDIVVRGNEEVNEDTVPRKKKKKKKKKKEKMSIAELKGLAVSPDLVELHDVNAKDPKLLIGLKSIPFSVEVPKHWSNPVQYLRNKKGMEKEPFQLPEFIQETGIQSKREEYMRKMNKKSHQGRARHRLRAKLTNMDIDYQILYDAFYKYQKKPRTLTSFGEIFHEGKDEEIHLRGLKPGKLSEELKKALGMPKNAPPPWLMHMQQVGPPPSYPNIRIPGLNAPIPEGAQYGFQPGAWGKPPVDEEGRPLYGNQLFEKIDQPRDIRYWGELDESDESSDDDD